MPYDAVALMRRVRERATDLMPVEFDAEPEAPKEIGEGASLRRRSLFAATSKSGCKT